MSLPNQIDLLSGADKPLQAALWLIWLLALLNVLVHAQAMNSILQFLSAALLLISVPRSDSPSMKHRLLRLHANGNLNCDELQGRWQTPAWRSPWYTVVRIRTEDRQWWAWFSASNNSPDDYRRLGIWCRYSPQQPAETGGAGTLP